MNISYHKNRIMVFEAMANSAALGIHQGGGLPVVPGSQLGLVTMVDGKTIGKTQEHDGKSMQKLEMRRKSLENHGRKTGCTSGTRYTMKYNMTNASAPPGEAAAPHTSDMWKLTKRSHTEITLRSLREANPPEKKHYSSGHKPKTWPQHV